MTNVNEPDALTTDVLALSPSLAEWIDTAKADGYSEEVIALTMLYAAEHVIGKRPAKELQ